MHNDVTVSIREGTYRIVEPIVFGTEDSGTEKLKIVYQAYPGETPVISGGRVISDWKVDDDGTWQTEIPEVRSDNWHFRELFINGERRRRCRHPNEDYFRVEKVVDDRRSFQFKKGEFPVIEEPGDAELVLLHDWSISRNRVKSVDQATLTIKTVHEIGGWLPFWRINGFEEHPRYWLENHPLFLDAPGEWYLDRHTGILRYCPMPNESPTNIQAVAPAATQLLVLRGDASRGKFVKNLHFRGLSFMHSHWSFDQGRYAGAQACFHQSGPKPAKELKPPWNHVTEEIAFESAEFCRIEDASIANVVRSNLLILSPNVPPIRYNNTKAEDIKQENNRVIKSGSMDRQELKEMIEEYCGSAGLEKSYRVKLLGNSKKK